MPIRRDSLDEYDYDTALKGGYTIAFRADDTDEYLFLRRGDTIITKLSDYPRAALYKNLGYKVADFADYFVLVHSFGSGNPHEIELIEKRTGKDILDSDAIWIDANERKGFLLYGHENSQGMVLYNSNSGKEKKLPYPKGISNDALMLEDMKFIKVSPRELVVRYFLNGRWRKCVYHLS